MKGKRITWIRLGRHRTQAQLAEQVGVSVPTVRKALHGLTDTMLAREIRKVALRDFEGREYEFYPYES